MTPTILGIILTATLTGTGAVGVKYYLNRQAQQVPVCVEHNLEQVIGDIIEEHIQRNSEESDTEIKIDIHIHRKERDSNGSK